jgi:hypothetical protein
VIAYLRQYWTSLRSAFTHDWVHHLLRNRFTSDFSDVIGCISRLAADADGSDHEAVAESLCDSIAPWLRDYLRLNYGLSGMVRGYIRARAPSILIWLKMRRRFSLPFERRSMPAKLRKGGASPSNIVAFAADLALIEEVIKGSAFHDFLRPHAAKLAPDAPVRARAVAPGRAEALGQKQDG